MFKNGLILLSIQNQYSIVYYTGNVHTFLLHFRLHINSSAMSGEFLLTFLSLNVLSIPALSCPHLIKMWMLGQKLM